MENIQTIDLSQDYLFTYNGEELGHTEELLQMIALGSEYLHILEDGEDCDDEDCEFHQEILPDIDELN